MNFYLVRHGSTELNGKSQIRGWLDVPLDEKGKKEAVKLGKMFKKIPLDILVCSDMKRAHDTAKVISDSTGIKISEIDKKYRPWDVGDVAGSDSNKAGPILQRFITEMPDKKLPNGESFNQFKERYLGAVVQLLRKSGNIAVVTHHRNDRVLVAWLKAGQKGDFEIDPDEMSKEGIPPGGIKIYSK